MSADTMPTARFATWRRHPDDYTDLVEAIAGGELPPGSPVVVVHNTGTVFGTVAWCSASGEDLTVIDVAAPTVRLNLKTSRIHVIHRLDR